MTREFSRRHVLEGIGAAGLGLAVTGRVTAGDSARYVATANDANARENVEAAGFSVQHELADGGVLVVTGADGRRDDLADVAGVGKASYDLQIEFDEPAEDAANEATDEPFYSLQWDKQVTDVPEAHETATGAGARIAVVDTGIKVDHPDLAANVNADAGRLFRYGEITHDTADPYGHGTHVAGIAAGVENDRGVVGTAPDAELVSLRVFYYDDVDGDGDEELTTTTSDIFLAVDHAADIGADAANMSLGTPPIPPEFNAGGVQAAYQRVVEDAVRRGTVVVVSAGNSDADLQHGGYFVLPTDVAGALSISATGPNDRRSFYSNYGTDVIDVGAPGGGYETLEKTLADDTEWPYPTNLVLNAMAPDSYLGQLTGGNLYAYLAGTSMSSPQVSGTVALVREVEPDSTSKTVERAIKEGAEGVDGESSADLGAGRLNAARALDASVL
jgi:subtilisin family serine protease